MADDVLLTAAGRIADGEHVDWASITSSLPSEADREIADELAVVAQIAAGHRQLHYLLPVAVDTPPSLMPERARWGHLDLLNIVGRGSYGVVYRAWDTRLERLVALKLFHGASHPDAVMQEGRMLARVRHENVVAVYGADMIDGVAGLWMELVHGRTLDNIVKASGPLNAREAAAIGVDIAKALAAIHAAGLLHCDIKAQNVVRENSGRVVLMDLGAGRLAPEMRDVDETIDVAGTPRYMAPELFAAGAAPTRASDIYSFGVLIYFLVSGRYPIEGKTLGELRRAHEAGRTRTLADAVGGLPQPLLDLVSQAMDRDPANRPGSIAACQEWLEPIAATRLVEKPQPSARWWIAVPVLGAVVLAMTAWLALGPSPFAALPPPNTLAVMPIRNLTGDASKQYLADGLTEVLIAHLARMPGLEVASSASMAMLRGSTQDERAIAEKLGVRLVLAGAVMEAENTIRLSVTLNDPYNKRAIWGGEIQRRPDRILTARSEIASLVAARLSLGAPKSPVDEVRQLKAEAQDAFIRGVVELSSGSNARMVGAAVLFDQAAGLEPAWADPLAHLAYAQQMTLEFGDPQRRQQGAEIVRTNALRAIALDPTIPMSYTALAAVQAYHEWDFEAAESTLRQAIESAPRDATAHARLSLLLAAAARLDEALREATTARDLEPLVPERHTNLGIVRYYSGDYSQALEEMEHALALSPNFGLAHLGKGRVLAAAGRLDDAIESVRRATEISPNPGWYALLATYLAQGGRTSDLQSVMRRLKTFEAEGALVSIDNYAYIAAYEGRFDEAFRLLDEAVSRRMTNVLWLAVDPRADVLRMDPRFDGVLTRMGLVRR